MSAVVQQEAVAPTTPTAPRLGRLGLLLVGLLTWLVLIAAIHLTQGSTAIGLADLLRLTTDSGPTAADIVLQSRLPRLLAGLLVGAALAAAGATMQALSRNPLASPDTLAVNAGAYAALAVVAGFGIAIPLLSSALVAFAGGLAAAALVLALANGRGTAASPIHLVLAGSVIALGLASVTSAMLLIFSQETRGLFAWGAGSLGQGGLQGVLTMTPLVGVGLIVILIMGHRLDLLQLGDEAAALLGIRVVRTRVVLVLASVLLAAAAVTVAGPIGFVGLCAPVLVRIAARWIPALTRQRTLVLTSCLVGAALLLSSDVLVRMVTGMGNGTSIPTGVMTTALGGLFLVVMALRMRSGESSDTLALMPAGTRWGLRHPWQVIAAAGVLLISATAVATLVGDSTLLMGDIANYLNGIASPRLTIILDARLPRLLAAVLAGCCLALAGGLTQAVTRNPLADPGILGVSGGAGLGAVITLVVLPAAGFGQILLGAGVGAAAAALVVFGLSARDSVDQTRLVLVGLGVGAIAAAGTSLLLVATDPWNQARAITWLGGSTFGATWGQQVPMVIALALAVVVLAACRHDLDLIQLDDLSPRILGIGVGRTRLALLATAVLLTGAATASIGVVAFVGLVAPHAARLIIGRRHVHLLPMTALVGATLMLIADTVGRTALAPMQLPAGLVTALIGAPYFIFLLGRMRLRTR